VRIAKLKDANNDGALDITNVAAAERHHRAEQLDAVDWLGRCLAHQPSVSVPSPDALSTAAARPG
jgi:hypothetical protein